MFLGINVDEKAPEQEQPKSSIKVSKNLIIRGKNKLMIQKTNQTKYKVFGFVRL